MAEIKVQAVRYRSGLLTAITYLWGWIPLSILVCIILGFGGIAMSLGVYTLADIFYVFGVGLFIAKAIHDFRAHEFRKEVTVVFIIIGIFILSGLVGWTEWKRRHDISLEQRANFHFISARLDLKSNQILSWQNKEDGFYLIDYRVRLLNTGKMRTDRSDLGCPDCPKIFGTTYVGIFIRPKLSEEEENELFAEDHLRERAETTKEISGFYADRSLDSQEGIYVDGSRPITAQEVNEIMAEKKFIYVTTTLRYRDAEGPLYSDSCCYYMFSDKFSDKHFCLRVDKHEVK